jgi:hypothetical protein
VELTEAVTVATGVTLEVPTGKTLETGTYALTVGEGGTLSVAGTISVAGTLNVDADGEIEVSGELSVEDGATGDLKGTINVAGTGVSKDLKAGGGSLWKDAGSTGEYVFAAGAKAYVGGSDADDLLIGGSGDPDATTWIKLASGSFSNSQTDYVLDGEATLLTSFWLEGPQTLIIKDNGKLTVEMKSNVSNGNTNVYFVVVADGSKIVGEGDAAIEVKTQAEGLTGGKIQFLGDGNDGSGTGANFYNSTGTKLTTGTYNNDGVSGGTLVPVGTYNWDAAAGGENVPGWKAAQ